MTRFDGVCFPEADYPWLPTLLDIEVRKSQNRPGYEGIGFEGLVLDVERHPRLAVAWDRLKMRFNNRYAYRMLNTETLQRWQVRLQNRLDEISDEYERAYLLYEQYSEQMNSLQEGHVLDRTLTIKDSGSDTDTMDGTTRRADTPDSVINLSNDYADAVAKRQGTSTRAYGKTSDHTTKDTLVETGIKLQMNIVRSFKSWVDLDTSFVAEFENNFLNIYWY
jgi:hypothetical protein